MNQKFDAAPNPLHTMLAMSLVHRPVLCALALLAHSAAAQIAQDQRVELSELEFIRQVISQSMPVIKQQALDLLSLEQKAAAARQYDTAIQAREKRQALELELLRLDKQLQGLQTREQALKAMQLPDRIELPLAAATLQGPKLQGGEITSWSRPGASATWTLPSLPAGGYEVVAKLRCGPLEGGILELRETKYFLKATLSVSSQGAQEQLLGTLKLSPDAKTLTLVASSILKDNLFNLSGLWLVPTNRALPPGVWKRVPPAEGGASAAPSPAPSPPAEAPRP